MISYTVDVTGQAYKRNRLHLIERATPTPKMDEDIDNSIPDEPEAQQDKDKELSNRKEKKALQK